MIGKLWAALRDRLPLVRGYGDDAEDTKVRQRRETDQRLARSEKKDLDSDAD
jgi:hypothetical protein